MRGLSPSHVAHLSQNRLQPLLLSDAQKWSLPGTGVHSGMKVVALDDCTSREGLVRTRALDVQTNREVVVESRYVVGADGFHSTIRDLISVPMVGSHNELGNLANIHFISTELRDKMLPSQSSGRPAMLYFCYNERVVGVVVCQDAREGEFSLQLPFFPPHQSAETFTPEVALQCIRDATGISDISPESITTRCWTMNCQVAEHFRRGSTFLVGDAAHVFPPAGGFGMNTGIQDAYNLAWKLAWALQLGTKQADALLSSYESERRGIALSNAQLSVKNWRRSLRVAKALGLDPDMPLFVSQHLGSGEVARMTGALASRMGMMHLESLRTPGDAFGEKKVAQLRRVLAKGEGLPLLFPRHDVGYVYGDPAGRPTKRWRPSDVVAGARMPHFILRSRSGKILISTVDLPAQLHRSAGGASPILILSGEAVLPSNLPFLPRPTRILRVLSADHSSQSLPEGAALSLLWQHLDEFKGRDDLCAVDGGQALLALTAANADGALVRPDGHVSWVGQVSSLFPAHIEEDEDYLQLYIT
jgi:2-polyprenyl-6-methoxyphenol hydroxylase-like FAD-dependent oxidoreductase